MTRNSRGKHQQAIIDLSKKKDFVTWSYFLDIWSAFSTVQFLKKEKAGMRFTKVETNKNYRQAKPRKNSLKKCQQRATFHCSAFKT